jgi:hypothetical protein
MAAVWMCMKRASFFFISRRQCSLTYLATTHLHHQLPGVK